MKAKLAKQVDDGLKRKDKELLKKTFNSHKDPNTNSIIASSLESALDKLGTNFHPIDLAEEFKSRKGDTGLNFQEFTSLVSRPSPIEEWVRALPVIQLVADAMPKPDSCISTDQLRHLSDMTKDELTESCEIIMAYLKTILLEALAKLKEAYTKLDATVPDSNHKFQMRPMSVGKIDDFHKGLAARIGKTPFPACRF